MKKFLFLIVMGIGIVQLVSAQFIDVVGKGVLNEDNPTLTIPNMETVDHVIVEATAEFVDNYVTNAIPQEPQNVFFSSGANVFEVEFKKVDENKSPMTYIDPYFYLWEKDQGGLIVSLGYYATTFDNEDIVGGEITLDKNGQNANIMTFYAYIYRIDGTVNKYSYTSEKRVFLFWNGIADPIEYEFDLPVVQAERNIKVTIPFSDNFETDTDYRIAVLYLVQGEQILPSETFNVNALGTNFLAKTIELGNVPGDVTKIIVAVYSPEPVEGDLSKTGDSFILGMPVLTVEEEDPGCTLTQGYWKTHSIYGPASKPDDTWIEVGGPDANFYLSDQTWIEVFNTSASGNSYYQLAHQYMAAFLNMQNGAMVPTVVQDAMDEAESIFEGTVPSYYEKIKGVSQASKDEISHLTSLASTLGSYNEGIIGPGHCGESDDIIEKSSKINNEIIKINELLVYPNPAINNVTVSFITTHNGLTTVDLYNSLGQKATNLFSQNVNKDVPVSFTFDGRQFNKGLYFLLIQNGLGRESVKIEISR